MVSLVWKDISSLKFILAISVVLRIVAAFYLGDQVVSLPGTDDQVSYHNLALRVLDGQGFTFGEAWWPATAADAPTAHWSYLYTLYLVVVYTVFGPHPLVARLIQAIAVGLLQPILVYQLAKQVFGSWRLSGRRLVGQVGGVRSAVAQNVPLIAAGITAVYLYFVYYAATLMTEAFYIVGLLATLTLSITLAERIQQSNRYKLALGLGLVLSATVLLRQLFLLFLPFLFLWIVVVSFRRRAWRPAMAAVGIATAVLIFSILPFTVYNYARFERFVLLNTNAGYAFFWANHHIYGDRFIPASEMESTYQELIPPGLRHLDEAALDQELLKEGLRFVLDDPGRYARLSLSRIPVYFKFWPDSASSLLSNLSRVASFAVLLPFILYGLLRSLLDMGRAFKRPDFVDRFSPVLLLYLFIVVYTAIHILSWVQIRYRLPVDAILTTFAALAIADLVGLATRVTSGGKASATLHPRVDTKRETRASS